MLEKVIIITLRRYNQHKLHEQLNPLSVVITQGKCNNNHQNYIHYALPQYAYMYIQPYTCMCMSIHECNSSTNICACILVHTGHPQILRILVVEGHGEVD